MTSCVACKSCKVRYMNDISSLSTNTENVFLLKAEKFKLRCKYFLTKSENSCLENYKSSLLTYVTKSQHIQCLLFDTAIETLFAYNSKVKRKAYLVFYICEIDFILTTAAKY